MDDIEPLIRRIVDLAVEEDLGRDDVTTRLTVPAGAESTGRVIARQDLVVSGGEVFAAAMQRVDSKIDVNLKVTDGERAKDGDIILTASGKVSSLLMAERVALNFLAHLCGVATLTRQFVDRLPAGSNTVVADTRKTTPGMRLLERRAVLHGGGHNHRADLGGGVLIKENHIAAAGSVKRAIELCKKGAPHSLRVEVEVRDTSELQEALDTGAEVVLLDNMNLEKIELSVQLVSGRAVVEVSGGVDLSKIAPIAALGVDVISIGALTHSAPAADLSFLLDGI